MKERSRVKADLKGYIGTGGNIDLFSDSEAMPLLRHWGKWCRMYKGDHGLGYAKRTVEGRLMDGELMGGSGSGEFKPPSDDMAEQGEEVVSRLATGGLNCRVMARLLRLRFSSRRSYQQMRVECSKMYGATVRMADVKRLEAMAIAHVSGAFSMGRA